MNDTPLSVSTKTISTIILCLFIFVGGYWAGSERSGGGFLSERLQHSTSVVHRSSGGRVDFDLFWRAWDLLGTRFVDQGALDPEELMYGAIRGMFAATGDPYTTFFDPELNKAFNEDLDGSFEGIGAEIGIKDSILTIIAPLDGSPAERAGLRPGDKIINIDGMLSADLTIEDAVKNIRGDKGTDVVLTIYRDGEDDTRDITVTRDTIVIESVVTERVADIPLVRVSQFGLDTSRDLASALKDVAGSGASQMIIDLRNNPGGVLEVAIDAVGDFVPRGSVAVIEQNADGVRKDLTTRGAPIIRDDMEIVILINQGSASASEIFAAALKHHAPERVTLVGEKSFGKGSVQELVPMKQRTAAKITIAKWLTPGGEHIDGEGIAPDVEVAYTNEDFDADRDPQRDRAIAILSGSVAHEASDAPTALSEDAEDTEGARSVQ